MRQDAHWTVIMNWDQCTTLTDVEKPAWKIQTTTVKRPTHHPSQRTCPRPLCHLRQSPYQKSWLSHTALSTPEVSRWISQASILCSVALRSYALGRRAPSWPAHHCCLCWCSRAKTSTVTTTFRRWENMFWTITHFYRELTRKWTTNQWASIPSKCMPPLI